MTYFKIYGTIKRFILINLIVSFSSLYANNDFNISNEIIEKIGLKFGLKAKKRVELWKDVLKNAKSKNIFYKLKDINDFWNKLKYQKDLNVWQKDDYWANPFEFLAVGAGDSEDYAIGKYISLLKLGIPSERLKILFINTPTNKAHAVLTYYHNNKNPIILDNTNKKLTLKNTKEKLKTDSFMKIDSLQINEISQTIKIKYHSKKNGKEIILNTLKL